jgi:hypothetical protein
MEVFGLCTAGAVACYSIRRETGTASEEEDGVRIFAGRLEANFDSESLKYKNRR